MLFAHFFSLSHQCLSLLPRLGASHGRFQETMLLLMPREVCLFCSCVKYRGDCICSWDIVACTLKAFLDLHKQSYTQMKHANRANILNKQLPLGIQSYILCLLCAYLIFIFQLERVYLMSVHILLTSRTPRTGYMTCIIKSRIKTHANKYIRPPSTRKQCDGYQLF